MANDPRSLISGTIAKTNAKIATPLNLDNPGRVVNDRITASANNAAQRISPGNAASNFKQGSEALIDSVTSNPLDFYDLASYNLKLYMADPRAVNEKLNEPPTPRIVLAASGVTDIAFKDLSFVTIMAPNNKVYTSTYTQFDFTLFEPLGCTFLDRIAEQAAKNGIDNFVKCPYWLEITFVGRDPETGRPIKVLSGNPGPDGVAKDLRLVIPIKILDVKINIQNGSTEYRIKAVRFVDSATFDNHAVTKRPIVIEQVGSVREFFEKLGDEMRQISQNLQEENSSHQNQERMPDVYTFQLGEEFAEGEDLIIRPDALFAHPGDQAPYHETIYNKTTATIPSGTDLMRAIDMIMSTTRYMEEGVKPENPPTENEDTDYSPKRLYRIETDVNVLGYDKGRGDYAREFIYRVRKLTMTDIYPNPGEGAENRSTLGLENTEEKAGVLFKDYRYLYEGNKDVISFDSRLNAAWFLPLPRQYGTSVQDVHQVGPANDRSKDPERIIDQGKLSNKSSVSTELFKPTIEGDEVIAQKPNGDLYPWPLSYASAPLESDQSGVVEGANDNARSFVSSIFKSGMMGLGGDLLQSNLVIRGDPDWLFVLNVQQIYIRFSMGLPSEPGDNGLIKKDKNNMINGYYRVLTVKNEFSNGKFTQTINGVRDVKVVDD